MKQGRTKCIFKYIIYFLSPKIKLKLKIRLKIKKIKKDLKIVSNKYYLILSVQSLKNKIKFKKDYKIIRNYIDIHEGLKN